MQLEDALVVKFLLLAHSAETVAWSYLGPSDFDYLAPGGGFPAAFRRLSGGSGMPDPSALFAATQSQNFFKSCFGSTDTV
jgi:hypothetical protein